MTLVAAHAKYRDSLHGSVSSTGSVTINGCFAGCLGAIEPCRAACKATPTEPCPSIFGLIRAEIAVEQMTLCIGSCSLKNLKWSPMSGMNCMKLASIFSPENGARHATARTARIVGRSVRDKLRRFAS